MLENFREREATILKMRLGFSGEVKILEEVDQKNGLSG
jgi:DNA-directed RNA polymerase sigma subunit (sigma70/sigma32)